MTDRFSRSPASLFGWAGRVFILPAIFLCVLPVLSGAKGFDFREYTFLRDGSGFVLYESRTGAEGDPVGSGSVNIAPALIKFAFTLDAGGRRISARGELRLVAMDAGNIRMNLKYTAAVDGTARSSDETVVAERFIAERGILSFFHGGGKHFFQMSRWKGGQDKVVTQWGAVILRGK